MENLKVGDIKKFKYLGDEKVGVVVYTDNKYVRVCTIDGKHWNCEKGYKPLEYSATRLEPKLREALERIAEVNKKVNKIDNEINKLYLLKEKEKSNLDKEVRRLAEVQGKLTPAQVSELFNKLLEKYHPTLYAKLHKDYDYDYSSSSYGIWIQFDRHKMIDTWCSQSMYDFIYWEYDHQMMIGEETPQYKSLCRKHSNNDAKFTMNKFDGEFKTNSELQAGGKDSIVYHHTISIRIPPNCLTKQYVTKLVKSIKY